MIQFLLAGIGFFMVLSLIVYHTTTTKEERERVRELNREISKSAAERIISRLKEILK